MRRWAVLALLVALVPFAMAKDGSIPAGDSRFQEEAVAAGATYRLEVTSDVPIDVLLYAGEDDSFADAPEQEGILRVLNTTSVSTTGTFPAAGTYTLVLDNSGRIQGGANGTQNATVAWALDVTPPAPPPPGPAGPEGSRNPWPVLMLTSPYWDLGVLGLGGMALWFLLLAALAAVGYREGWPKVGVLTAGVAALVLLWSLVPNRGPVTQVLLPLLIAAGVAWIASRGSHDGRQALRMAFLGAGLGALLGVAAGHLLSLLWSDAGMLLLGNDRFDDPVFVLPVTAGLGAFLLAFVAALVTALEDEEAPAAPGPQGITPTFNVDCLRCGTPIKVDRSMRRYRVATDRYEFACPNCHAWMEWAEPKAAAAAA